VNVQYLALSASLSSCRTLLEKFADDFRGRHATFGAKCSTCIGNDDSNTAIFKHFEVCPAVTKGNKLLLGPKLSQELRDQNIQLPTRGSFAQIYKQLSDSIHNHPLTIVDEYVLVPGTLGLPEKRFLIRFIKAHLHMEVLISTGGEFRNPYEHEIATPPKPPNPSLIHCHSGVGNQSSKKRGHFSSQIQPTAPSKKQKKIVNNSGIGNQSSKKRSQPTAPSKKQKKIVNNSGVGNQSSKKRSQPTAPSKK
jgi:hypothetical protein